MWTQTISTLSPNQAISSKYTQSFLKIIYYLGMQKGKVKSLVFNVKEKNKSTVSFIFRATALSTKLRWNSYSLDDKVLFSP